MKLNLENSTNRIAFPIVLTVAVALLTSNPLLTVFSVATFWFIYYTLWKRNQPPILFAAFALQWLQVSIKIFQADLFFLSIEEVVTFPVDIRLTIILSLLSIVVIVIGIGLTSKKFESESYDNLLGLLGKYNLKRIILIYSIGIALSFILIKFSFAFGGIRQFIVKFVDFKWAIFFVFYLLSDYKNRTGAFLIILAIEIILGFTGYFSNFKDFIIISAVTYLFSRPKFTAKELGIATFLAIITINLMIFWQNVKGEYRSFLSEGEKEQVVRVSKTEALDELGDLAASVELKDYSTGAETLVDRIAYIDYFSATINNSGRNDIAENGALWGSAITNVFMPRFLFPNKAIIDDSEKTRKYTGLEVAGQEQGTSISLGYVAETYVDFGPILMFLPLFGFGLLVGWMYKFIVTKSMNTLWGFAFAIPLFFNLSAFETALDKIVGGLIAYFLVYRIFNKFFTKIVHDYLIRKNL